MFVRIPLWSHLSWTFVYWEAFDYWSMSSLVIGLSRFFLSSWLSLGRLYVSRNQSISSRLTNMLVYNFPECSLMIIFISVILTVMSSSLILNVTYLDPLSLFVSLFFFFFLMSQAKSLSILFIFSKIQLLVSAIFSKSLFHLFPP